MLLMIKLSNEFCATSWDPHSVSIYHTECCDSTISIKSLKGLIKKNYASKLFLCCECDTEIPKDLINKACFIHGIDGV